MSELPHVLLVAKAPRPGWVKTRLHAAYTPDEAAQLATAALQDTVEAVRSSRCTRRILALDGPPGPWIGSGFEVVAQVRGSLNERLAAAWDYAGAPGLQIGMDTPQVSGDVLDEGIDRLLGSGTDAVLGLASDGGWWGIGLRRPVRGVFEGVEMSRSNTGEQQLARLRRLGLRTALLPELRDMDRPDDVAAISRAHPHLRTAAVADRIATGALR